MTTPSVRYHCAALAVDVDYLLECIRDGSSDPLTLQGIADRANTARDALAAEPAGERPGERIISIAKAVQEHAFGWEPDARLIGNVCAEDVADLCGAILAHRSRPPTPPAPEAGESSDEAAHCSRWLELEAENALAAGRYFPARMLTGASELLARWGRPAAPPPPEVGEAVGNCARVELVVALHSLASQFENETAAFTGDDLKAVQGHVNHARKIAAKHNQNGPRCAPAAVPVEVAERLPGEGDCDAEGRCWLLHVDKLGLLEWHFLDRYPSLDSYSYYGYTHWLPAHAIPLPQGGEGEA